MVGPMGEYGAAICTAFSGRMNSGKPGSPLSGVPARSERASAALDRSIDALADAVASSLDMKKLCGLIGLEDMSIQEQGEQTMNKLETTLSRIGAPDGAAGGSRA